MTKTICVFCGSSAVDEKYLQLARETGAVIAAQGFGVVYGGAHIGMMGQVADSALKAGAHVTGIIPAFLQKMEVAHTKLSEFHLTKTMHERQVGMMERADAFIVLPGGLGTLAEFFEILTWKHLGLLDKPIILVNPGGYWDSLLAFNDRADRERFYRPGTDKLFETAENIEGVKVFLSQLK